MRRLVLTGLALLPFVVLDADAAPGPQPQQIAARTGTPASKVTTPTQRCAALEKQFDEAARARGDLHGIAAARKLRAEGGHLCDVGRHAAGALRLSQALEQIGLEAEEP